MLLRISLIVTNRQANCWNPLSLVWKYVEGTVCVMCLAQKVVGKKKAVGLGGQKVHTFGWINFVCIEYWVRSLTMSLYIGVSKALIFSFWFCIVLRVFVTVVVAGKSGSSIISEMFVNILWFIGCTHNVNKSSNGRFIFVGYYTVDPQW